MDAHQDVEALLRHADWLARLARRLVADGPSADDLVQETWITALRRPPDPSRPARPWLAGVIRRLALVRHRRESRHIADALPETGTAPSAEESAVQVELQRTVAGAVLALDEPFRSAILLRYYRALSTVDIARELGVPEATVRTRIKRGLERLRARLDQEHGGDGRTWISALAPLVARPHPDSLLRRLARGRSGPRRKVALRSPCADPRRRRGGVERERRGRALPR